MGLFQIAVKGSTIELNDSYEVDYDLIKKRVMILAAVALSTAVFVGYSLRNYKYFFVSIPVNIVLSFSILILDVNRAVADIYNKLKISQSDNLPTFLTTRDEATQRHLFQKIVKEWETISENIESISSKQRLEVLLKHLSSSPHVWISFDQLVKIIKRAPDLAVEMIDNNKFTKEKWDKLSNFKKILLWTSVGDKSLGKKLMAKQLCVTRSELDRNPIFEKILSRMDLI